MSQSSPNQTVAVELGQRSYDITIGNGTLESVGQQVRQLGDFSQAVVIADTNTEAPHAHSVCQSLASEKINADLLVVEAGDTTKCVESLATLWDALFELGAGRDTLVVAVGGGMVGDLAGFVAATYNRGVPFFQVPTSLLAMVDSSVGGKTGINLVGGKNLVGAFKQPIGVHIDTEALATLPGREFVSGLGEVVKYGVILDEALFELLEENVQPLLDKEPKILAEVIARCCQLKADVVIADEQERSGVRAKLNYGHTFAHPIETLSNYEIRHGEAVGIGMVLAAELAKNLGHIDEAFCQRQRKLFRALGIQTSLELFGKEAFPPSEMLKIMYHDKKVVRGELRFVLPDRLGNVELVDGVSDAEVLAVFEKA